MATSLQAIRQLTIRARSDGMEKVAADLEKIASAQEDVAASAVKVGTTTEASSKKVISTAGAYDLLKRKFDENYRSQVLVGRGVDVITRALDQGHISATQAAEDVLKLHKYYNLLPPDNDNLAKSGGLAHHQLTNLSFQLNDITTGLLSGQSPFQIMAQQGGQVVQILQQGEGGIGGGLRALSVSMLALLTPTNLVIAGVGVAIGSFALFGRGSHQAMMTADEAVKRHTETIGSIKGAYGEAAVAADAYGRESRAGMMANIRANIAELKRQLSDASGSALAEITSPRRGTSGFGPSDQYMTFRAEIDALRESAARGEPDIRAFREAVLARMNAEPNNEALQSLGLKIRDTSRSAADFAAKLGEAKGTLGAFGESARGAAGGVDVFAQSLSNLSKIGLPDLGEIDKAAQAYQLARSQATNRDQRDDAYSAYQDALGRLQDSNVPLPRPKPNLLDYDRNATSKSDRSAASKAESEAARQKKAVDDVVKSLAFEKDQLGRNAREQAQYNALQSAGIDITSSRSAEIMNAAAALYDYRTAQEKTNETLGMWKGLTLDATKGFISDIRSGTSALDAFENALTKIEDRLIDMALNAVFDKAFSTSGSGAGGNILSSILSAVMGSFGGGGSALGQGGIGHNAAGTSNWRGGATWVGENGPELAILPRGTAIVPNSQIAANQNGGGTRGGSTSITVNNFGGGDNEIQTRTERGPDGEKIVLDIVRKGMARGDLNSSLRARGINRPKVR